MTTTRQKVFSYLMKARLASAREVARALKMSVADARHHLRVLASDGRLEVVSARRRGGRGRPEKVYSLPRAALGDNLSALGDALLTEAGSGVSMEALAERLAGDADFSVQPIPKRLNLTVERLNRMNYHARWEAGAEGPHVIFTHCPYAKIVANHPELCVMDQALLEMLMGMPAMTLSKIREGSSTCLFAMTQRV